MKVALCFLVVILVVSIEAFPQDMVSRIKRGFRNGASDRFSHGFGKRTDSTNDDTSSLDTLTSELKENLVHSGLADPTSPFMSVGEMSDLLRSNPKLAYVFVRQFVDKNGDGGISADELFGTSLS